MNAGWPVVAGRLEWRLAGEGLAAATTAAGVRVDEGEAAAFHAVDEVHGHTVEQRCAGVVDQHGQAFFDQFWREDIDNVMSKSTKDPKTDLQEKASADGFGLPEYLVIERSGPDHRPLFVIEVDVPGLGKAKGTGKSKKDAERYAAMHLLENWPKK